jgi:hypothetical protein
MNEKGALILETVAQIQTTGICQSVLGGSSTFHIMPKEIEHNNDADLANRQTFQVGLGVR